MGKIEEVVTVINEKKRVDENMKKILELQNLFDNVTTLSFITQLIQLIGQFDFSKSSFYNARSAQRNEKSQAH